MHYACTTYAQREPLRERVKNTVCAAKRPVGLNRNGRSEPIADMAHLARLPVGWRNSFGSIHFMLAKFC